jgi:DNA segregation ATPase FtsK/SpoIIIE, S-DNA-T family
MSTKLTERHFQEFTGVLLLAAGLLILISLLSYDPEDPSLTSVTSFPVVHNLAGKVGALLADSLFQTLGGGAYLLSIGAFVLGWRGLLHQINRWTYVKTLGYATLLFFIPALLDLWFHAIPSPTLGWILQDQPGGVLGRLLNGFLTNYFNPVGAHIITFAGLVSALMLVSSFSPVLFILRTVKVAKKLADTIGTSIAFYQEKSRRWKTRVQVERKTSREKPKIMNPRPATVKVEQPNPPPLKQETFEFVRPEGDYQIPPLSLLSNPPESRTKPSDEELIANSRILEKKLLDFNIDGRVTQVHPGPVVTMYEFEPAPGVKVNQIVNLSDDLALAMRSTSVRIVAPLPGKSVVGIEIPNNRRENVYLKEVLGSETTESQPKLPLALGKDIFGTPIVADLATMPHLLVAGATGSGKSVALNAMILSLVCSVTPNRVKFIMMDPKLLELSAYEGIPHLMTPVLVKAKDTPAVFSRLVIEMQNRYRLLAEAGVRNIEAYNLKIQEVPSENADVRLPYLVVIVDELADLMAVAARDMEDSITRLAQMARAAGIHLILATQRPSVDVLTGIIKANFPARIAFQVSSKTDSRTILDANGAEQLLGRGDMLFLSPGSARLTRVHGAYVSEAEIRKVVDFVKAQAKPQYVELLPPTGTTGSEDGNDSTADRDELYEKAVDLIIHSGVASASLIQRRLRVGYPRAARMIEMMEEDGIVGPPSGGKPREVLAKQDEVESREL